MAPRLPLRLAIGVIAIHLMTSLAGDLRASPAYVLIDLDSNAPVAINQMGQIALRAAGGGAAAIWQNGTVRNFGVPPGYALASGEDLNDFGQLVGRAIQPGPAGPSFGPPYHAFFWDTDGSAVDLGVLPGAVWSRAEGINNQRQIVGTSGEGVPGRGGLMKAVLWDQGRITVLGPSGRTNGAAHAMSDAGDIVGWAELYPTSQSPGPMRAVLWRNGAQLDLGSFGGMAGSSVATDVNESGAIVGYSSLPNTIPIPSTASHAFVWRNGSMIDLGVLPGAESSRALAINEAGQIVGQSESRTCGSPFICSRAVLWTAGQIVDLNTLLPPGSGWYLFSAVDIDDQGRIVGDGWLNGASRHFLLDVDGPPAPDPPRSLAAIVTGAAVTLTWQPPASGAPGSYLLEAGSRTGAADLATLGIAGTSTSVTASAPAGTYFVRLRSREGTTLGPASNEVTFTVGGAGPPPGAPVGLQAQVIGSNVALSWSTPVGGLSITTCILEAGSAPGLTDLVNAAVGPVTSYAATTVPRGTYYVRVRASNAAGTSAPSNEVVVVVP